jgi:hypothetical protein
MFFDLPDGVLVHRQSVKSQDPSRPPARYFQ